MSIPRLLKDYCKSHWRGPFLLAACCGMLFLLTMLYRAPVELPRYTGLLLLCLGAVIYLIEFVRWTQQRIVVQQLLNTLPTPIDWREMDHIYAGDPILKALHQLEQLRNDSTAALHQSQTDAADYYALWAHQVKTPLAALRLLVQENLNLSQQGAYLQELYKLEQYVDMVLSYTKLKNVFQDISPGKTILSGPVSAAAKRVAPLFIYQTHTRLQIDELHRTVVTDEKWLAFALEQLLTNAVKYTPHGTVHVYLLPENPDVLVIEDTGIGISAEDLPRVCQRGFTGKNGHLAGSQRSTGIGLYLTKEVLSRLGHPLSIESTPGKGTKVHISFARPKLSIE